MAPACNCHGGPDCCMYRFHQADVGAAEYREPSGRWMIERSFLEGPRGGRRTLWILWASTPGGGWHEAAAELRLKDLWQHISEAEKNTILAWTPDATVRPLGSS